MTQRLSLLLASPLFALVPSCSTTAGLEGLLTTLPAEFLDQEWHVGPDVHVSPDGPARFVASLHAAFDMDRAMKTVEFVDGFYRAPANYGYDEVIDKIYTSLERAGFGGDDPRLKIQVLEENAGPAWTPLSGELTLLADGEAPNTLHGFDSHEAVDRVMLPINTPSCSVEGEVALSLSDVKKGMILVTDVAAAQVLRRAQARGAAAVISASLEGFNEDHTGKERHFDAIQFRSMPGGTQVPVAQISRNSLHEIEAAVERASIRKRPVRLRFKAEVEFEDRPLRTIVATIVGAKRPGEAVAIVSHVQEPGANDNASGVGGLLESARSYSELIKKGELAWPSASLVFIWGDEFSQSEVWLASTDMTPLIGISSDMTGQARDTGAVALLERMPDPGAISPLPPDAHTPWGAGQVNAENLKPNGLAVIARCAMVDVGLVDEIDWLCADHPWEGGSDHDVFIAKGIPAVLFWHFTDFTYHTSLDRMEFVDPTEIRRTSVAILATALAVADPMPGDLDRYLRSVDIEKAVRVKAARDADNQQLELSWGMWCDGARNWLRKICLGIDEDLPGQDGH